jgi:hypothetical protein
MAENNKTFWENEFAEFLAVQPEQVPHAISENLLSQIHSGLHPSAMKVFGKVLFIQFAVGIFTLLFCPQFGVSLTASHGIMPYLMKFGDTVCMLGCGSLFTALSFLAASFALKPEEVRALRKHEILQLMSIATLSLGAFVCVGGEVVFALGLIWILGAIAGGVATLETGWVLRQSFARRSIN